MNPIDSLIFVLAWMQTQLVPYSSAEGRPSLSEKQLFQVRQGGRYYGIMTRVAQRINRTQSLVSKVARGDAGSERVWRELQREIEAIDRGVALDAVEYQSAPQKPRATARRVAQKLGLSAQHVRDVARGRRNTPRIIDALREELSLTEERGE